MSKHPVPRNYLAQLQHQVQQNELNQQKAHAHARLVEALNVALQPHHAYVERVPNTLGIYRLVAHRNRQIVGRVEVNLYYLAEELNVEVPEVLSLDMFDANERVRTLLAEQQS